MGGSEPKGPEWRRDTARSYRHNPFRGILYMTAGSIVLTSNDAIIKWLTEVMPIGQIMTVRGLLVCLLILVWLSMRGRLADLRSRNWRGQAFRAALMVAATFLFITSLSRLPLADAVAITFASPLFATALAVPLLGEKVGWRRWAAVLIGFGGVVLLAKPTGGGDVFAVGMALTVALLVALMDIATRRLNASETSTGTLFYTTLAVALAGLAPGTGDWVAPDTLLWGLLIASAATMAAAQFLQIEAFRFAGASTVAPFRYFSLISAMVLGIFVWGHLPDLQAGLGSLLILGSGLWIWHRERVRYGAGVAPDSGHLGTPPDRG